MQVVDVDSGLAERVEGGRKVVDDLVVAALHPGHLRPHRKVSGDGGGRQRRAERVLGGAAVVGPRGVQLVDPKLVAGVQHLPHVGDVGAEVVGADLRHQGETGIGGSGGFT